MRVLALSIAGIPHRWMAVDRAAYYVAAGKVAWSLGDAAITLSGGIQRRTGEVSRLAIPAVIALAKSESMVKHARPIPLGRDDNALLARRDKRICAYCGDVIASGDFTRDHIIPRARNGQDIWTNVVSAHRSCNERKGCRTPEQAGMPLLYVPYTPCRFEHFLLSGRNVLADQMDYLRLRLPEQSRLLSSGTAPPPVA